MSRREVAFDVETTSDMQRGPRPYGGDRIFAWQYGYVNDSGKLSIETFRCDPNTNDPRLQNFCDDFSPGIREQPYALIAHSLKMEWTMLHVHGYRIPDTAEIHCTLVMSQFINNLRMRHSLDYVAYELCPEYKRYFDLDKNVFMLAKARGGMHKVPKEMMREYQIADIDRTLLLYHTFKPIIYNDDAMRKEYLNEIALIVVAQRMEEYGIALDIPKTKSIIDWLHSEVKSTKNSVNSIAGTFVNLNKPTEISWLLHKKMGFPVMKRTKTGKVSTDKNAVALLREEYDHPVLDLITKYRAYARGIKTLEGYIDESDSNSIIHTNFKTNHDATGRLASERPNLQNVDTGRKTDKKMFPIPARSCFVPRPGDALSFVDQSGIELRLIIWRSGCQKMKDILLSGNHPHVEACKIFYPEEFVTKEENRGLYDLGKNGHFCICYGGGIATLAATLSRSIVHAASVRREYERQFPEIAFLASRGEKEVALNGGKIRTATGRVLHVPAEKMHGWLDYFIQGTAATIIKYGIVQCQCMIDRKWNGLVHIVSTVHDEIIFEIEQPAIPYLREIIRDIANEMINIPGIDTPLEVESKIALTNWENAMKLVI